MVSGTPRGTEARITKLEPLRPRGLRVRLHLDHGEPIEVTLEALERSRLGLGDLLEANRLHHLLAADADVRVREAALNLLSYRARTRRELQRKLRQKGFEAGHVDSCLDRLQERGLLDDAAVAAAFIRDRLRHRPRGRARLTSELRAKGVGADVVDHVLEAVFEDEEVTDRSLARDVAAGWVARQNAQVLSALAGREPERAERDAARRRLNGYLARRGFRGDALRAGVDRALELAAER